MEKETDKIYDFIISNSKKIAEDITACNFKEVENYQKSSITSDESDETTCRLIEYIASSIKMPDFSMPEDFLKYTMEVAERRAGTSINEIDLIKAIRMTADVLWDWIEKSGPEIKNPGTVFLLGRKINSITDKFSIDVTTKFLERQKKLIESQKNSLKIWDEVVKRTCNLDLKIPCTGEFVLIARSQAKAIATRLNMTQEEIDDFVLVIGEACDNAIEHGASEKGVDLHYLITRDEIVVKITDYGKGFDPKGKGDEIPDLMSERGRGIFLMKALSTSVKIDSEIGKGTTVTIVKQRGTSPDVPKCA